MTFWCFFVLLNQILKKIFFFLTWYLQSIQQDYTTLLSCLIQTFPNQPEFKDLVQLTDCHDPEMDFFENMKHIQVEDNSVFSFPLVFETNISTVLILKDIF